MNLNELIEKYKEEIKELESEKRICMSLFPRAGKTNYNRCVLLIEEKKKWIKDLEELKEKTEMNITELNKYIDSVK